MHPATIFDIELATQIGWELSPYIVGPLTLFAVLYCIGLANMRGRSGVIALRRSSIPCFVLGWISLLIALVSPIHELSEQLFWVHMTQHEILMLVSAPLLVLGQPIVVMLWALPKTLRNVATRIGKLSLLQSLGKFVTQPLQAWLISAFALWVWHAPPLFNAAVQNDAMHAAQHLSFFLSALLFWWALHDGGRRMGYGTAVLYVFTTAVHTSVLGALLTFSAKPWYSVYRSTTAAWGLTQLEDQQVGGLIMWIPAGTVLIIAGLILLARWLDESQRRWEYTRTAEVLRLAKASPFDSIRMRGTP